MRDRVGSARVEAHDGYRLVELTGDAYARGRQHGEALRDEIRYFRDRLFRDIVFRRGAAMGAAFTGVLFGLVSRMHPYIPRELRAELRGLADGARVSYRDLLLYNCFDDVLHGLILINPIVAPIMNHRFIAPILGRFACSSFVADGSRTRRRRLLHARNLDYLLSDGFLDPDGIVPRVLREHVTVFVVRPTEGRPYVSIAWPGFIGTVTGFNADGLSLACLTSAVARETPNGIPLPLLYRLIVQFGRSVEEAEWLLRGARRTIGNNVTVSSGRTGEARLFEFSMDRLAALPPREGVVLATNHFQHPSMAELQAGWVAENSLTRLTRLNDLFGRDGRPDADHLDVEHAQAALVDTARVAGASTEWDGLLNPGTIYGTVIDPARLTLWLRTNDRPGRAFVELDLADRLGARPVGAAA